NNMAYLTYAAIFFHNVEGNILYKLEAEGIFENTEIYYPLKKSLNEEYSIAFVFGANNGATGSITNFHGASDFEVKSGRQVLIYNINDGSKVGYFDPYFESGSRTNGEFAFYQDREGKITYYDDEDISAIENLAYRDLTLVYNQAESRYHFRRGGNPDIAITDMGGLSDVDPDEQAITNFVYDTTTGELAFDYTFTVGTDGRHNTTSNPLTVSGKAFLNVFNEIVMQADKDRSKQ
nr:hypothetical protein [Bacteroidota bacterium]